MREADFVLEISRARLTFVAHEAVALGLCEQDSGRSERAVVVADQENGDTRRGRSAIGEEESSSQFVVSGDRVGGQGADVNQPIQLQSAHGTGAKPRFGVQSVDLGHEPRSRLTSLQRGREVRALRIVAARTLVISAFPSRSIMTPLNSDAPRQ